MGADDSIFEINVADDPGANYTDAHVLLHMKCTST